MLLSHSLQRSVTGHLSHSRPRSAHARPANPRPTITATSSPGEPRKAAAPQLRQVLQQIWEYVGEASRNAHLFWIEAVKKLPEFTGPDWKTVFRTSVLVLLATLGLLVFINAVDNLALQCVTTMMRQRETIRSGVGVVDNFLLQLFSVVAQPPVMLFSVVTQALGVLTNLVTQPFVKLFTVVVNALSKLLIIMLHTLAKTV